MVATTFSISTAISSLGDIATSAWDVISGNPVTSVLFVVSLLGAGFGIISRAKSAAR